MVKNEDKLDTTEKIIVAVCIVTLVVCLSYAVISSYLPRKETDFDKYLANYDCWTNCMVEYYDCRGNATSYDELDACLNNASPCFNDCDKAYPYPGMSSKDDLPPCNDTALNCLNQRTNEQIEMLSKIQILSTMQDNLYNNLSVNIENKILVINATKQFIKHIFNK